MNLLTYLLIHKIHQSTFLKRLLIRYDLQTKYEQKTHTMIEYSFGKDRQ